MKRLDIAAAPLFVVALALVTPVTVSAMEEINTHIGAGVSLPMGDLGDLVDPGWRINLGATFYPSKRPLGYRVDLAWDRWDMSSDFLDQIDTRPIEAGIQSPNRGSAKSFGATFNLLWEPEPSGFVGFYLTGGAGLYYLRAEIGEQGTWYAYYCDIWFCTPTLIEGENVVASGSTWEWGLNVGGGMTFLLESGAYFYLETTYQWVDTEAYGAWVPMQFGWRW